MDRFHHATCHKRGFPQSHNNTNSIPSKMEIEMSSSCECCKAQWIKFRLDADLTSGDEKVRAKVYVDESGFRHFWQGQDPDPDDEGFDIFNLEAPDWTTTTSASPTTSGPTASPATADPHRTFQFSGMKGEIGLACLMIRMQINRPMKMRPKAVTESSRSAHVIPTVSKCGMVPVNRFRHFRFWESTNRRLTRTYPKECSARRSCSMG